MAGDKYLQKENKQFFQQKSNQDLIARAEASMLDIAAGRTINLKDFKIEIENWKNK